MAIYNNISSREIIRRVYDHYDIKTSDWEARAYDWINELLGHVKIYVALEDCHMDISIISNRAKLPCDLRVLRAVEIDGIKQDLVNKHNINKHDSIILNQASDNGVTYELSKTGYIISSKETGTMRIHYKKLPTVFDNELQQEIPLVPDNEKLLMAGEWYVLYRLMIRGYTHPVFNLANNNPELNPSIQWKIWANKASNDMASLNKDQRNLHSDLWKTLCLNAQRGTNYDVNSSNNITVATTNFNSMFGGTQ